MDITAFTQELRKLGSQTRAIADRRYHKSNREHWGVPVPLGAQLVKSAAKELHDTALLPFAKALWDTDLFDPMMCAAKVLALPRIKPSPAI